MKRFHSIFQKSIMLLAFCILTIIVPANLSAQPFRYIEQVFNKIDTLKNVEYSRAEWLNNPIAVLAEYNIHEGENKTELRPLFMDIFMPAGDTIKKRPAIIFAHSGGFLIGTRHNDDMIALCDSFARRGYVTATIDYRRGMGARVIRFWGMIIGLEANETNGYRAFYRAHQDARAAIRFLKQNAESYSIDTTKIFFTGSSAGAIMAIQNLFLDKPGEVDSTALIEPTLGGFDATGVQGFGAKANGVAAFWGSLQKPGLIENELTPLFLVHGTDDDVVPFKKGVLLGNIEVPVSTVSLSMPEAYGSFCIDTALQNREIGHSTYFVEGKKHEFYGVDTGEFPDDGPNVYWDTIIWKTSSFLFDIFKPNAEFNFETNQLETFFENTSSAETLASWDFGDRTFETGNSARHVYKEPGVYRVTLKICNNINACDTISKLVEVSESVFSQSENLPATEIFPNPAGSQISITGLTAGTFVRIYTISGQNIYSEFVKKDNQINIEILKPGVYILETEIQKQKIRKKFSKIGNF